MPKSIAELNAPFDEAVRNALGSADVETEYCGVVLRHEAAYGGYFRTSAVVDMARRFVQFAGGKFTVCRLLAETRTVAGRLASGETVREPDGRKTIRMAG